MVNGRRRKARENDNVGRLKKTRVTMHAFTITRPFTVVQRKRDIRSFAIDRDEDSKLRLRSEAEAPFRLLRLSLYGAAVGGSSIGLLVNLTQIVGAVASRPGAPTLTEALKNIAIDVVGVIIFAWLFGSDWKARGLQMKRLSRESELGKLSFLTISSKILKVSDLRSSARVVRFSNAFVRNFLSGHCRWNARTGSTCNERSRKLSNEINRSRRIHHPSSCRWLFLSFSSKTHSIV